MQQPRGGVQKLAVEEGGSEPCWRQQRSFFYYQKQKFETEVD